MIGFEDGTIRPGAPVTRAQIATILFRLMPDTKRAEYWSQTNPYPDVKQNHWFNNAVSTTTNAGLFTGMPDGSFQPHRPITRAELATVVARLKDVTHNGEPMFNDIAVHWAKAEINAVARMGWVTGYEGQGGRFLPNQPITRAETAAIINNAFERKPQGLETLLPDMRIWPDNVNPQSWYYLHIQEATNSHYYVMSDNAYEIWTGLIYQERDWARLELPTSRPEDINIFR